MDTQSDSECIASNLETQEPLSRSKWHKRLSLGIMALSNLCAWICISLIPPFFPKMAAKKGTSETVIGMIFSCSYLVMFLISPILGHMMGKINPRVVYICGLCVFGISDVLFGFLNKIPSGVPFIAACFVVRIVESIGTASITTGSLALAGGAYPDNIGSVFSLLETVTSVGFMFGPAIGGALYQIGGYGFPFWIFGGLVFMCGCASMIILPSEDNIKVKQDSQSTKDLSSWSPLRSPLVWLTIVVFFVVFFNLSELSPILSGHLAQFDLNQTAIGVIFAVLPLAFTSTAQFWGVLVDKWAIEVPLIFVGLIVNALRMLFLGPAPFLTGIPTTLWLTVMALAVGGFSLAPVLIASMKLLVAATREIGFQNEYSTFGLVGGIIETSKCIGQFVGPLTGSILDQYLGFGWTTAITSGIVLLPVMCGIPLMYFGFCKRKGHSTDKSNDYIPLQ